MDFSAKMWKDIPSVLQHHWSNKSINWSVATYIIIVHVVAFVGISTIHKCQYNSLIWAFVLMPISGFGISVGVHRLWSHRSFEASFVVRLFLMLCNSIANQGSIFQWTCNHRLHHKFSETNADPHNASRGFFYAHIGWLLVKKHPDAVKAGHELDFIDLKEDSTVMFQKNLDPWFSLYMAFIMPAQVATLWGEEYWNGFFVCGVLRYCVVQHLTWLVNSAAHLHGVYDYDGHSHSIRNPVVSNCCVREEWHDWHHTYPFDYSASEFGISSQYNPSKLLIDLFAYLGLVWGRKRVTTAWNTNRTIIDKDLASDVPFLKPDPLPSEASQKNKI